MVCEESKEKDNIEAPKFICHHNDNVPKIIRNNPKNDTSIVHRQTQKPTIRKDVTTQSTASIPGSTQSRKKFLRIQNISNPKRHEMKKEKNR